MWLELQIFGLRALWSPYYALFVVALAIAYYLVTVHFRTRFGGEEKPSGKQLGMFYSGLLLLYIVKGSPLDLLGHIMFTAHMGQMALYYLVFPILIIRGIPKWIWRKLFQQSWLKGPLRIMTKPLVALLLFNGLFSIYHIPLVFDFTKTSETAHAIVTTVILFTAFCMWWSVFAPIEEEERLSPLLKIGYIFANGILITPACGLIIFAESPIYATYSSTGAWVQALSLCVPSGVLDGLTLSGPELFSSISLLHDQQLGGIVMKITQEIVFAIIIAVVFFAWFSKENDTIDPLPEQA